MIGLVQTISYSVNKFLTNHFLNSFFMVSRENKSTRNRESIDDFAKFRNFNTTQCQLVLRLICMLNFA